MALNDPGSDYSSTIYATCNQDPSNVIGGYPTCEEAKETVLCLRKLDITAKLNSLEEFDGSSCENRRRRLDSSTGN